MKLVIMFSAAELKHYADAILAGSHVMCISVYRVSYNETTQADEPVRHPVSIILHVYTSDTITQKVH